MRERFVYLWVFLDCLFKWKGYICLRHSSKTQLPCFLHNKDAFWPALSDNCTQQTFLGWYEWYISSIPVSFFKPSFQYTISPAKSIRTSVKISTPGSIAFSVKLLICWERRSAFQGTLVLNFILSLSLKSIFWCQVLGCIWVV